MLKQLLHAACVALLLLAAYAADEPAPVQDLRGERVLKDPIHYWKRPTATYRRGEPSVLRLSPSGSSTDGNVTVLVSGTAFVHYGDVKVRFCSVEVQGHVLHEGAITCEAPPLRRLPPRQGFSASPVQTHACKVEVSLNGVDFTRSGASFWYYNLSAIAVARMHPAGGPVAGGTVVYLEGVGFADFGGGVRPKCRFAEQVVDATIESSQTARCLSPPTAATSAPVWLTLNGYTDERELVGGLPFRFAEVAYVSELHPLGGPSAGGAIVTVNGAGFIDDGEAISPCAIGDPMLCKLHEQARGMLRDDRPRSGLRCVFGARRAPDAVMVMATRMGESNEQVLCRTPPADALLRVATGRPGPWCAQHGNSTHCGDPAYAESTLKVVEIRVTLNANASDVTPTALAYMMLAPPAAPRVPRAVGRAPEGGTRVHIVGEELLSLTRQAPSLCRFGNVEVPATVGGRAGAPALFSSPHHTRYTHHDGRSPRTIAVHTGRLVTCDSPAGHAFGSRWVRVSVSLDGEHFSEDTLSYRYGVWAVERAQGRCALGRHAHPHPRPWLHRLWRARRQHADRRGQTTGCAASLAMPPCRRRSSTPGRCAATLPTRPPRA